MIKWCKILTLRPVLAALTVLGITWTSSASAAVIFDFASVSASTNQSLESGVKTNSDSSDDSSSTIPVGGLNVHATSTVTDGDGTMEDFATSESSVTARFAPDAASGEFIFAPQTTNVSASQPSSLTAYGDATGQSFYNFTLTGPAVFNLNYTIATTGDAGTGMPPDLYFYIFNQTIFGYQHLTGRLDGPGSYTSPVLSAGDYQFAVQNFDVNFSQLDMVGTASTSLTGDFLFNIASVPEPSSWAMMIGGFGVVGTLCRRRKAARLCNVPK